MKKNKKNKQYVAPPPADETEKVPSIDDKPTTNEKFHLHLINKIAVVIVIFLILLWGPSALLYSNKLVHKVDLDDDLINISEEINEVKVKYNDRLKVYTDTAAISYQLTDSAKVLRIILDSLKTELENKKESNKLKESDFITVDSTLSEFQKQLSNSVDNEKGISTGYIATFQRNNDLKKLKDSLLLAKQQIKIDFDDAKNQKISFITDPDFVAFTRGSLKKRQQTSDIRKIENVELRVNIKGCVFDTNYISLQITSPNEGKAPKKKFYYTSSGYQLFPFKLKLEALKVYQSDTIPITYEIFDMKEKLMFTKKVDYRNSLR